MAKDQPIAAFAGFACTSYPREVTRKLARDALARVRATKVKVIDAGFSQTHAESQAIVDKLHAQDFDLLIVCVSSWIETPVVITVVREFRHKPMLLWGLGGYTRKGSLVSPAAQAGTPPIRAMMDTLGVKYKYVWEHPNTPIRVERVHDFAVVAKTVRDLSRARIGMMGYADMGLYMTMFDGPSLRAKIGPEVDVFDMLEVEQTAAKIGRATISRTVGRVRREWKFDQPVAGSTLERLASIYCAVDKLITERGFSAISLKCVEGMKKYMNFPPCLVLSMLGDRVPAICEDDAMGLVTQLMLKGITGQATTFMETYEFFEKSILMGVCGFAPGSYVCGRKLASVYGGWGGLNEGVMNVSPLRMGTVTLARLGYRGDRYSLHVASGKAVDPGKWEELGWNPPAPQFPGIMFKPEVPVHDFAHKMPAQHYLMVYGDLREPLADLCNLLGIEMLG
jgi:L-fucose isomerase-like protein